MNAKKDKAAGKAIGEMRKSGELVSVSTVSPKVAYLLDTTAQVFGTFCEACAANDPEHCKFADPEVCPYSHPCGSVGDKFSVEQQRELIFSCDVVIVECSFMAAAGMSQEEAEEQAIKRGHVAWSQLRPIVLGHPEIIFVLAHFSNRYKDAEIGEHFRQEGFPANVVLWLDSGLVTR